MDNLKRHGSKAINHYMVFTIILCFFVLFACKGKKEVKNNNETESSIVTPVDIEPQTDMPIDIDAEPETHEPIGTGTSIILLPRDEYSTYSDHYNYISEEKYFDADHSDISHFDDTISTGFLDNDYAQGLVDSLRLDMDWVCMRFSQPDRELSLIVNKAKTVSYSYNEVIDLVPMTLLSVQDTVDEYLTYDIAFRGEYEESDFNLMDKKKLSPEEQSQAIQAIQKKVRQKDVIPPRPMSTDTLLLDNICKPTDNMVIARYKATTFNDSDADFGNDCIFVLQNNNVVKWFAGMGCRYEVFELGDEKYLYIYVYTYATGKTTLLKITENNIEEVYTYLFFGD